MKLIFKNLIEIICNRYNLIEEKVCNYLIKFNTTNASIVSLLFFMLFNIFWIFITYFTDLIILFLLLLSFIMQKKYFLFFKLIVNEVLDKLIFFILLYKFKTIYFFVYTIYLALKYFFNTENEMNNVKSIVEWIIYIDGFFINIINKKKEIIIKKLHEL